MIDRTLMEQLAGASPLELDRAADLALAEAFPAPEPRARQFLLLAALARAVAHLDREAQAVATGEGKAHYHIGRPLLCVHQHHTRTMARELSGLPCPGEDLHR